MLKIDLYICTKCGACVPICHVDALRLSAGWVRVDQHRCDLCRICIKLCPTKAILPVEAKIATV